MVTTDFVVTGGSYKKIVKVSSKHHYLKVYSQYYGRKVSLLTLCCVVHNKSSIIKTLFRQEHGSDMCCVVKKAGIKILVRFFVYPKLTPCTKCTMLAIKCSVNIIGGGDGEGGMAIPPFFWTMLARKKSRYSNRTVTVFC